MFAWLSPPALGVLVTPTSITHTGTAVEFFTEEVHLIDGSGLSGPLDPSGLNIGSVTHGNASQDTAWVTDAPNGGAGDYFDPASGTVVFEMDLGGTFNLTDLVSWPYNFGAANGNTLSAATLEFSTNGGTSYSSSQNVMIPLNAAMPANANIVPFTPTDANFIRMTVTDNHLEGAPGGDRAGLAEIRFLDSVDLGTLSLIVDRDSGQMSLDNGTASDIEIAGFGINSASGSLESMNWNSIATNLDAASNGGDESISSDKWVVFSSTAYDLSEGTTGVGTLPNASSSNSSIDLGMTWIQNPTEDVEAVYLDANTGETVPIIVQYTGTIYEEDPIKAGDYNADGVVDASDWPIYKAGYRADLSELSPAQAYLMGDLNGDGINNSTDFGLFKAAWEADNPGMSFSNMIGGAAVPEPGCMALLAIGLACFGVVRTTKMRQAMCAIICLSLVSLGSQARAELPSLVSHWDLDANAIDAFGSNNGAATNVTYGAAGANANTGTSATFNGTDSTITVPFSPDLNPESFTVSLWTRPTDTTGYRSPITSRDDFEAGVETHGYIVYITPGGQWSFWTGDGDPGWAAIDDGAATVDAWTHVAISFDAETGVKSLYLNGANVGSSATQGYSPNGTTEMEDLHIGSGSDPGTSFYFQGDIDDVGVFSGVMSPTEIQNVATNGVAAFDLLRMELRVDPTTGASTLYNATGGDIDLDQYEILSPTDSINFAGWNDIESNGQSGLPQGDGTGNGWEVLGTPSSSYVGEGFLQGATTLAANASIPLGNLFDTSMDQDLEFYYRTADGTLTEGVIDYEVLPAVAGDYNGDGTVNISDYTVWRNNLGASDESAFKPGTGNGGGIDASDYTFWKERFGNTAGSGSLANAASQVPEPSTFILLSGLTLGCVLAWKRQLIGGTTMKSCKNVQGLPLMLIVAWVVLGSTTQAAVSNDRAYLFGDPGSADATLTPPDVDTAANVGNGNPLGFVIAGSSQTGDDIGPSGAYLDLTVAGDPRYADVSAMGRPGASGGDFGARFDGIDDYLFGIPLNRPDELGLILGDYPINYTGITGRGIQAWAYPTASAIGSPQSPTTYQSIVFDTIFSGGPAINAQGQWTQSSSFHVDGASGVGAVPASGDPVEGDTWYHLMHHNYIDGAPGSPQIVSGSGAARPFTSVLFVDGLAVSANNDNINTGGDPAFVGRLVVGGAEVNGDGLSSVYGNYFDGVVDDLEMYVYGDNTSEGGENYGTFDLFADNEWIADQIANDPVLQGTLLPGDANKDGVVNGDGSGDPASDDVAAFVAGWGTANVLQGAHNQIAVGDWLTWEAGDFNHDGVTNFTDWYMLRANHVSPASLDLGELLGGGTQVPEPSSLMMTCGLLAALGVGFRLRQV